MIYSGCSGLCLVVGDLLRFCGDEVTGIILLVVYQLINTGEICQLLMSFDSSVLLKLAFCEQRQNLW